MAQVPPDRRPHPSRREVLAGLGALGAWGVLGSRAAAAAAGPIASGGVFPTGVRAGTPTPHGITLMATADELDDGAPIDLLVARDPGFAEVVLHRSVRLSLIHI